MTRRGTTTFEDLKVPVKIKNLVAQGGFAVRLLVMGVDVERRREQARARVDKQADA